MLEINCLGACFGKSERKEERKRREPERVK
jgi:hypothetical protein